LEKISINRFIFKLKGKNGCLLFHKSVVEKIMAANPVGGEFVKVSSYKREISN
jgi:hypoxanthine-guanine phosphoribosyltransferase